MPRLTVKELVAKLEAKNREVDRLVEANSRLQDALREQGDMLRTLGSRPVAIAKKTVEFHCPICFEPLSDMDPTLRCSHELCRKCCSMHFLQNSTCPICRKEATPKELWRFRNSNISKYWALLRGEAWPKFGDFVLVTTTMRTIVGRHVATSNDKKTITIMHHLAEWEIQLDNIQEIFTAQSLADALPVREDGLRRMVANE